MNTKTCEKLSAELLENPVVITIGSKQYDIKHITTEFNAATADWMLNIHAGVLTDDESDKTASSKNKVRLEGSFLKYGDDLLYTSFICYDSVNNMFYVPHNSENTHWNSQVTPEELRAFADFIENHKQDK